MKILVIAEQRQGKWNNTSFETLVAAQQIAAATSGTISALVIGKGVAGLAGELAAKNVAEVLLVEHDLLEAYTPDGYCVALSQVISSAKPDLVLFPHTYQVRDFAPKLAAMLGKGMIGDCIGYRNESGKLVFVRQMFQGKTAADVTFVGAAPWFASFQSGAFRSDLLSAHPSGKAPVTKVTEAGTHSHQAAGVVQGSKVRRGFDAGAADRRDWARDQGSRKYSASRSAGKGAWRRNCRLAADLR
jgi:electron transfer flavoprotein alpha subunit